MACYKLTSCTASNNTVVYTTDGLTPAITGLGGFFRSVTLHPGVCFEIEQLDPSCPCINPVALTIVGTCSCTTSYVCYELRDCLNIIPPFKVISNLNPYVGSTIKCAEYPGQCFLVNGIIDVPTCSGVIETISCVETCVCAPVPNCYELENCGDPTVVITVNINAILTLTNVYTIVPAQGYPNPANDCWKVITDIGPCTTGTGTNLSSANDFGPDECIACAGPAVCYELTDCQDPTNIIYSQEPGLSLFIGNLVSSVSAPGICWRVAVAMTCPAPVAFASPIACLCPCYTLTNCVTGAIINTNSDLSAYIGLNVHLDEYGGCGGDCWSVAETLPPATCNAPATVTVSGGCAVCPPCDETCYELVDCETDIVFVTLLNPTVNAVDLGTLIGGQTIGTIQILAVVTNGCWYVRVAPACDTAVAATVTNIYDDCTSCKNSCYGLLNCQTLVVDYVIKYTVPNPNPLIPNPSTLVGGAIGDLCFTAPTGCVPGCYQLQLIEDVDCAGSVDWTTVVSYTDYDDCDDCLPKCYLLTECLPAVSAPFVVNNDLSIYVGSVAKICDSEGICHCYHIELAQSCDGAITIDNANAKFITCEECNSCGCPPGFVSIDNVCQKIETIPATSSSLLYTGAPGSTDTLYGLSGTKFYNNITTLPYPITAIAAFVDHFEDASSTPLPFVPINAGVWGSGPSARLKTVGLWTTVAPLPLLEWIGFSACIQIPTTSVYCIGIAGDDQIRIKIDGVLVVIATIGVFDFNSWHVFEVNLTAGTHTITLEGWNDGGPAAFGAEIYNVDSATLQTFTTVLQLQPTIIFTTFDKRSGAPFQTGELSGFTCPAGYTLNLCDIEPSCTIIETIPFVVCPPTYLVTDCTGTQEPFITNTDLSIYTNNSFKTCIPAITYSATCFILKDCNKIVGDIVTNTDLTLYLWQSVTIVGYPGSCFIVTGVPVGDPCVSPIAVTVDTDVACLCQGAQQPWPEGCYCVTVEEIPFVASPNFEGVFSDEYECCEDCLAICYLLTSCLPGINPVIVCNDLADYVGLVIKIESCGDICWQVALADNCDGNIRFSGEITLFEDCANCLPPPPPTPPPYDLNLRKIKPGYNSPNSCVTLEYLEKVNCTFAEQVYNNMLISRYGITVCCDEDINTWDIRKQLLDLTLLKDPSMCKSTLCDCPPPCLIDAILTLLPFCGAPIIVAVDLDLPCGAPVLISAVIEVPVIEAPCYCWSVDYDSIVPPLSIYYIDCCCVVQEQFVSDIVEAGNIIVCAQTAPVTYLPNTVTPTNTGLCGTGLCDPHPAQICSCWQISNPNPASGLQNYTVDQICPITGLPLGTTGTLAPGQLAYVCSIASPTGDAGLVFTNTGPCRGYCGPIPPDCVCYSIESTVDCNITTTNCETGLPETIFYLAGISYVCSSTPPGIDPSCDLGDFTISPTPYDCSTGNCAPPFPCDCYEITVTGPAVFSPVTYYDCNGVQAGTSFSPGTYYLCGSNLNIFGNPNIALNILPNDCTLGECLDPACECYQLDILTGGAPTIPIDYKNCGGVFVQDSLGDGTYYICAATVPSSTQPGLTVTPAPGNPSCPAQCS